MPAESEKRAERASAFTPVMLDAMGQALAWLGLGQLSGALV
jgi:hypothetical protein